MSGIQNAFGFMRSAASAAPSSQSYTTAGTYSWVAPAGVTSVSVVAVGGGAGGGGYRCCCTSIATVHGGGGGGLGYQNNLTVVPGNSYSVNCKVVCRRRVRKLWSAWDL